MLEHTFGVGPGRLEVNCHQCSPSVNFAGVVELLQYISDNYNYFNIRINRVRDAMRPNMARRSRGTTESDRCISLLRHPVAGRRPAHDQFEAGIHPGGSTNIAPAEAAPSKLSSSRIQSNANSFAKVGLKNILKRCLWPPVRRRASA